MSATFTSDFLDCAGPLSHFWEHTVGSDHAPVALRADWREQLRRTHVDLGFRHVRFHGILCDDMGTLSCCQQKLLYSFFNCDSIVDFLLSIGMRPFVELSFMPAALASGYETVFHYRANITPPWNYQQWSALIGRLVAHWIDRYGIDEVRTWFFEVWNEPNLKAFWPASREDYFELYRHAVLPIKALDDRLKVGGPATAMNAWIDEFLEFCDRESVPVDFVSTHHYPTDNFGEPDDDTVTQLSKSRRSVLREQAQATRDSARGKPVYYTEWNSSSDPHDPLHDEPYAAAFAVKTVMEANGLVEGYSFWTFSDIFEENYFPSVPFHGGFGLQNLHGIPKPAYRAFQLLHRLGESCLNVAGEHPTVDAWVVRNGADVTILLVNFALPRHPVDGQQVSFTLAHAPKPESARIERIDADHANAKGRWQAMGAPEYLSSTQVAQLTAASELQESAQRFEYRNGVIRFEVQLPPLAVAAVTLEFEPGGRKRVHD
jgi:xylan 1,4-beta-xylosidase